MSFGISWSNPSGDLAFSDSGKRITFQRKISASFLPSSNNGFFTIPTGETNQALPPIVFSEVLTGAASGTGAAPLGLSWSGAQWVLECGAEAIGPTASVTAYIFNLDLGVPTGSDWGIETYGSDGSVSFSTKGKQPLLAVAKLNFNRGPDSSLGGPLPIIGTSSATLPAGAVGLGKLATNVSACTRGDTRKQFVPQSGTYFVSRFSTPVVRSSAGSSTIQTDNVVYYVSTGVAVDKYSVLWSDKVAICIDGDMYS